MNDCTFKTYFLTCTLLWTPSLCSSQCAQIQNNVTRPACIFIFVEALTNIKKKKKTVCIPSHCQSISSVTVLLSFCLVDYVYRSMLSPDPLPDCPALAFRSNQYLLTVYFKLRAWSRQDQQAAWLTELANSNVS